MAAVNIVFDPLPPSPDDSTTANAQAVAAAARFTMLKTNIRECLADRNLPAVPDRSISFEQAMHNYFAQYVVHATDSLTQTMWEIAHINAIPINHTSFTVKFVYAAYAFYCPANPIPDGGSPFIVTTTQPLAALFADQGTLALIFESTPQRAPRSPHITFSDAYIFAAISAHTYPPGETLHAPILAGLQLTPQTTAHITHALLHAILPAFHAKTPLPSRTQTHPAASPAWQFLYSYTYEMHAISSTGAWITDSTIKTNAHHHSRAAYLNILSARAFKTGNLLQDLYVANWHRNPRGIDTRPTPRFPTKSPLDTLPFIDLAFFAHAKDLDDGDFGLYPTSLDALTATSDAAHARARATTTRRQASANSEWAAAAAATDAPSHLLSPMSSYPPPPPPPHTSRHRRTLFSDDEHDVRPLPAAARPRLSYQHPVAATRLSPIYVSSDDLDQPPAWPVRQGRSPLAASSPHYTGSPTQPNTPAHMPVVGPPSRLPSRLPSQQAAAAAQPFAGFDDDPVFQYPGPSIPNYDPPPSRSPTPPTPEPLSSPPIFNHTPHNPEDRTHYHI